MKYRVRPSCMSISLLAGLTLSAQALASTSCDAITAYGQSPGVSVQPDGFNPSINGIGGSFAAGDTVTVSSQTSTLSSGAAVLMNDADNGNASVVTLAAPGSQTYSISSASATHHFYLTNQGANPATVVWTCSDAAGGGGGGGGGTTTGSSIPAPTLSGYVLGVLGGLLVLVGLTRILRN